MGHFAHPADPQGFAFLNILRAAHAELSKQMPITNGSLDNCPAAQAERTISTGRTDEEALTFDPRRVDGDSIHFRPRPLSVSSMN